VLLFADASEALTHPSASAIFASYRFARRRVLQLRFAYLARVWAKRGADLRVEAPGQSEKIAMIGALDFASRELIVETSQTKRRADGIALLERLDQIHGSRPGTAGKPVTIILDNGRSTPARPPAPRSPSASTGSSRNGCQNTRPN
jgi:DDE superfamily endonuclease